MMSVSVSRPLTSLKPAVVTPSISTVKLNDAYGSLRAPVGICVSSRLVCGGDRQLAEAEDHELRGLDRRDADEADQSTAVDVTLGHRRPVAADEERLLRRGAGETTVAPETLQEVRDATDDPRPGRLDVVLEHDPLGAPLDRLLEV